MRSDSRRRVIQSIGPLLIVATLALLSAFAGEVVGVVVFVLLAVGLSPVARSLGQRFLLGFTWGAGLAGGCSISPAFPISNSGLAILASLSVVGVMLIAWRQEWPCAVPEMPVEEILVMIGGASLMITMVVPIWRRGAERLLIDVSNHLDNLAHYTLISDLMVGVRAPSYNYGYHVMLGVLSAVGPGEQSGRSPISIEEYAYFGILLATCCGVALGFLALQVADAIVPSDVPFRRWALMGTGLAFAVSAPLAGAVSAFYIWGHVNFLWAVTAVTVASWLALKPALLPVLAVGLLTLGVIAAFSTYRSTQVGMAPATFLVTKTLLEARKGLPPWVPILGATAAGGIVFAGWVPFHYYNLAGVGSLYEASTSQTGASFAVPGLTIMISLALLVGLTLASVRRFGVTDAPARIFAPIVGFGAFSMAFAVQVVRSGDLLVDNYYVWKSASAMFVAGFPALLAGAVVVFMPRDRKLASEAFALLGTGVTLAAIVLLPVNTDGRPFLPAGLNVMLARSDRLDAWPVKGASVHRASRILEGTSGPALVFAGEDWGWPGALADVATRWANTMRGTKNEGTIPVETCLRAGSWAPIESCLTSWLRANPSSPLTLVDVGGQIPEDTRLESVRDNVEIIRLDSTGALAPGSSEAP